MSQTTTPSGADVAPTVYAHGDGWLCTGTGSPQWLHNCRCPAHGPQGEEVIKLVLEREQRHAQFQAEEDDVKSAGAWLLDAAEAERALVALEALIARNAELEAEVSAMTSTNDLQSRVLASYCDEIARLNELATKAEDERDALAAENKALREALSIYAHEYNQHWVDGMPILEPIADAALARTPAKGEDSCDSAT